MSKRKVANPLALAVLACLAEKPMHPYEMASTMRERHKDESIRLNYGSLYTVVQGLQRHKLIDPLEVQREGNRPERTVFRLTEAGRLELIDWLSELLSVPEKEFTQFEAGLSLLPVMAPEEAVRLLEERCKRLEVGMAADKAKLDYIAERGLPRLFWIEADFRGALKTAELAFVRALIEEIEGKMLDGYETWQAIHRAGSAGKVFRLADVQRPAKAKSSGS